MAKTVKGTAGKDVLSSTVSSAKIQALGGNDTVNNYGNSVTVDGGAGDDLIFNYGSKVSINGGAGSDNLGTGVNSSNVTITGGAGNDYFFNSGDGIDFINGFNAKDTLQISGLSYSTATSGNDFIVSVSKGYVVLKNSAGIPVKIKNASGKVTTYNKNPSYLLFGTDYDDVITNTTKNATVSGAGGNDTIWSYVDDAVIFGDGGNDMIFLGEGHGKNAINYSVGDGYDTVYGFGARDVVWAYDTFWNTSTVGNDVVLTFQNGAVTLKDTASIHPRLALNATDNVTNGTILANTEIIDASTRKKAIKITCNELANEMYGGAGKDSFYGNGGNDKLYGQAGDDTLSGDTGNDTLTGGAGNDLFIYTAGNDVITDYASGDKISLGAALSKATLKGSDAVLTVGKGTLTVKDAKTLTLIDSKGKEFTTVFGSANIDYNDTASSKVTLASGIEIGDASARTKAINITGNALDNSILGGAGKDSLYGQNGDDYLAGGKGNDKLYGDAGDDTLYGGKGNDTLWGGNGSDTFIYNTGEGKDVIADFANNDMLQITGTFSATYNKSKNTIAFKVGSTANALTLKDFTATTFNINGTAYRISGKKLVKQ